MRKPQITKRVPIVKHEDKHHTRLSIAPANFALTQILAGESLDVCEGILDGSVMIYKV